MSGDVTRREVARWARILVALCMWSIAFMTALVVMIGLAIGASLSVTLAGAALVDFLTVATLVSFYGSP